MKAFFKSEREVNIWPPNLLILSFDDQFHLLYVHTQYIPIHLYIHSQWGGGIAALARPPSQCCGYIIIELVG